MATTPSENVFNVASTNVNAMLAHSSTTKATAASHFGTDFRIPDSTCYFQIQTRLDGLERAHDSNIVFTRVRVTVILNYRAVSRADENQFMKVITDDVRSYLLVNSSWQVDDVYDLADDDGDPEIEDIEKEGKVLTSSVSLTVLARETT